MSERRSWRLVEESVTRLRLAVWVQDDLTGEPPVGTQQVTVDGEEPDARSDSGAYLAFGPPTDETVTVSVQTDERYESEATTVDLDGRDPRDPVALELRPTTAYEFPRWATLLRGRAIDGDDDPIPGVEITVETLDPSFETDAAGEFAYYFTDVGDDVVARDGETVLELDGSDPVVTATHPDGRSKSKPVTVPASSVTKTTFVFP